MQTHKYFKRKRNSSTRYFMRFMSLSFILIFSIILHACYLDKPVKNLEVYNEKTTKEITAKSSNINFNDEHNNIYNLNQKSHQLSQMMYLQSYKSTGNTDYDIINIDKPITSNNDEDKKVEQNKLQEPSQIQEELTEKENTIEIIPENPEYNIIKTYEVPAGYSFKSYTNYKLLSKNSKQGKLQEQAYTGETGIRMVDDYYCAALGTYYDGNIGDKFLVTLSSGKQFKMILCDVKADCHTDSKHQYTKVNGCMIEFYVDYSVLSSYVKRMGNISYIDGFEGEITCIQKIEG